MQEGGWVEKIKTIGVIVSAIMGGITLIRFILSPIWKKYKAWREVHPPFRKTVLKSLEHLQEGMKQNTDFIGALARERLEGAYTLYVHQMKWCPFSEKEKLHAIFDQYRESGMNHLSLKNMEAIFDLPEFPPHIHQMEGERRIGE